MSATCPELVRHHDGQTECPEYGDCTALRPPGATGDHADPDRHGPGRIDCTRWVVELGNLGMVDCDNCRTA